MNTKFVPSGGGFAVYFGGSFVGTIASTKSGSAWFSTSTAQKLAPRMLQQLMSDVQDQQTLMAVARRLMP
jgi:hypothetical protein